MTQPQGSGKIQCNVRENKAIWINIWGRFVLYITQQRKLKMKNIRYVYSHPAVAFTGFEERYIYQLRNFIKFSCSQLVKIILIKEIDVGVIKMIKPGSRCVELVRIRSKLTEVMDKSYAQKSKVE